ncbi:MAG: peptide chain release factor N(5)-glutamine methyltransferase [Kiritimatiellae bacterium]|nr:peptide chain release factor N(5)-glutamine methyltransferase [Kiritimatiellia bacterium]
MKWRETLSKTVAYLDSKGVDGARTAGELMVARLLGVGRGFVSSRLDEDVSTAHIQAMRRGISRLVAGEPLQYVLGEWDFRSLTLKCDRRALIPRPETEELVTRVLAFLGANFQGRRPFVVDVGTGTGAIVLSIAREFKGEGVFLGTDVSADAVQLAKENAAKCSLDGRVKFAVADGLDDFDEPQCVDVIVSNPPYIESAVCETLERGVRDFEPRLALDGGADGLDFFDRYLSDALNLLKEGGAVFFEIGENQGKSVAALMHEYGFSDILVERDFAGHDRYASCILRQP